MTSVDPTPASGMMPSAGEWAGMSEADRWIWMRANLHGKIAGIPSTASHDDPLAWLAAEMYETACQERETRSTRYQYLWGSPGHLALIAALRSAETSAAVGGVEHSLLQRLADEFGCSLDQYNKNGPDWTHKDGTETLNASVLLDRTELIEEARAYLKAEPSPNDFDLPCDVKLPPATTIKAGCSFETLKLALSLNGRPKHFPSHRPAPVELDERAVCKICNGGPGNGCACNCGMEKWDDASSNQLRLRAVRIVQAEAREMGYCDDDIASFSEPDGDGLLTVQAVERAIIAALSTVPAVEVEIAPPPADETKGWAYFNEDTGMEWSERHPVRSGEVPDASDVKAMTLATFKVRHPIAPASNAASDAPTITETVTVAVERDELRTLLANAYEQGCYDIHNNYQADSHPDFAEGALAYADEALAALSTDAGGAK